MTTLTPEEEKEFTFLNLVAFDCLRADGRKTKTVPPFWLCCSDEAKADAVARAVEMVKTLGTCNTPEMAAMFLKKQAHVLQPQLDIWKAMETEAKGYREAGNPRAFFCEEVE